MYNISSAPQGSLPEVGQALPPGQEPGRSQRGDQSLSLSLPLYISIYVYMYIHLDVCT